MSRKPAKIPNLTPGQTIFLGSAIVLGSLGGFYANLLRMQRKKQERGSQPHYEYVMGHVPSRRYDDLPQQFPVSRVEHPTPAPQRLKEPGSESQDAKG